MKPILPLFREGIEWRRLTAEERRGKKWKYILLKDVFVEMPTGVRRHYDCMGGDGHVWMKILPKGIVVSRGYAWNGNTNAPDKLFGVWLLLGSLPHDALFQFSGCIGFPPEVSLHFANGLYQALSPGWIGWAYRAGLFLGSWVLWGQSPPDGETVISYPLYAVEPT